jgi:HAE1 family hydrophobic/amphiphilic exporter-1
LLRAEDAASGHGGHDAAASRRGFYGWLDHGYSRLLAFAMRHRLLVASLALIVIASNVPLYQIVKQEYIPSDVDEAEFDVNMNGPEGTNLAAMNDALHQVEKELLETPGVRLILATAGGGFIGGVNQGSVYVRIAPHEERKFSLTRFFSATIHGHPLDAFRGNYSQRDVMQEIRKRLAKYAPLRFAVRNAPSFNIGGGNNDIDFGIKGPELLQLSKYAEDLRQKTKELGGIVDADTTLKLDKPELRVNIDRARAADLGVDSSNISDALRLMVGGDDQVSRFHDPAVNEDYDVQLRLTDQDRSDTGTISRLTVPSSRGNLVRLSNLVNIKEETSPSRVDRLDRQRIVSLRAAVAPGYALADRLEALRRAAAAMNMPAAYSYTVSGKGREMEKTLVEFVWAFLLSIAFMYMILASQFESTIHPITILLSLPLSVPFGLLGLWATGDTLNLYSALGVLVLFGVVKKNSILQIDHMNNLRERGLVRIDAIMQGNRDRLRPILMTTLALVAGMTPLAVGTGPGSEERRSIAVVVICGQTLSLLLTLIATPVAYSLLDDLSSTSHWRRFSQAVGSIRERLSAGLRKPRKEVPLEEARESHATHKTDEDRIRAGVSGD